MESEQNLMINDYISDFTDINKLRDELYNNQIMSKFFEEDNLLLIYTKYNEDETFGQDLKNECRSLVIDTNSKNVISYTCNTPICNLDAMNYLLSNKDMNKRIYKCYEGTLMSLFNNNNKWYLSTRRCLDSNSSVWNNETHYNLFNEVISSEGFENFDEFTNICNPNYCYHFILIHHKNKLIVDYTKEFGSEYKKLCLAFVREKDTQNEVVFNGFNQVFNREQFENVFLPTEYDSLDEFNKHNNDLESYSECLDEGVIIKVQNNNDFKLLKLQTLSYQFSKAIGLEKNIYKGFICLYQNNMLEKYLRENEYLQNFRKTLNPLNLSETYDTLGIIDAVFKVMTSELYTLFKSLWNLKTGKQLNYKMNKDLYTTLPREYKNVLYKIRGIYFKNKGNNTKISLQIKDIYQLLKSLDVNTIVNLLRIRKLMYNYVKLNPEREELQEFSKIGDRCDKVHLKLMAIFTTKLFPNIMPSDIPDF